MTYQTDEKPEPPFVPAIARRRLPINGWVYFLMEADSGRFKIGWARDVEKRLAEIQTGCAEELCVYAVLPAVDPRSLEAALHRRFRRLRLHGEWFAHSVDIVSFAELYGYEVGGTHRLWVELNDGPPPRLPPALRH